MTSTTEEIQKYVGQIFSKVKQELESQGYSVHEIRLGTYTTGGRVSMRPYLVGESEPEREKRAIVSYNYEDPDEKVTAIRRQDY
ncbi:unnamed protein product [Rotaria sp. Silwood1]|nr:unnamed protein product [Rotaria sp. Silwood1]CAF3553860.1 unnamed protein product [Rotaria sp. Silwood1]CAF3695295.1 unnamed protein product [Rotaria sp. Silwood1]CAF3722607.1 unnamed protein product [Rotaria sp. Silwood1]CAF3804980.1 unnamed protein product [Rotaria sp. Silwood1]